jgi:hypothetical protein
MSDHTFIAVAEIIAARHFFFGKPHRINKK